MTDQTETKIFLAIYPPDGSEVHVHWRGHATVEAATKELANLRKLLIGQKKKPFDCYVYEAEVPLYGFKVYELDEVDMNFYEEENVEQADEVQRKLDKAIYEVGVLAEEERKAAAQKA